MDDEREWARIEQELRRQPVVNRAAIADIMLKIHAPRPRSLPARAWAWVAEPRFSLSPIGALAAAVVVAAAAIGIWRRAPVATAPAEVQRAVVGTQPGAIVRASSSSDVRKDVQFVLVANSASDVRIVGDFNDWDPRATPMQRSGSGGVWSVIVPLEPGRHVYAFVVDGKQWVADVDAPRAPENEFGVPKSIVMVGGSS